MKLSVAVTLLASASSAAAFQAPSCSSTTSRRIGSGLNAVAIEPPTVPFQTLKQNKTPKERVEIDMTGIALSVRTAFILVRCVEHRRHLIDHSTEQTLTSPSNDRIPHFLLYDVFSL